MAAPWLPPYSLPSPAITRWYSAGSLRPIPHAPCQRCLDYPHLATLLRQAQASYSLHTPDTPALYEMITGPEAVAGLCFDEGLVTRILRDAV